MSEDFTLVGRGRYIRTAEHDSLVLDRDEQVFYWNSRELYGKAIDWLIKVRGMGFSEAKKFLGKDYNIETPVVYKDYKDIENKPVVAFSPLVDVFHGNYLNVASPDDYWHKVRGYTDETISNFKLGIHKENIYTIPIFVDGEFANFQCRLAEPKRIWSWYKGIGPVSFNFSILKLTDWVVLTEGPVDAIMLRQWGIPAASQTGAAGYWNGSWINYFKKIRLIYVVYDNDDAGNGGAKNVAENLGLHRTKNYNMWDFEGKFDVTDYFKNGGSKEEFLNLLENKSKFAFEIGD
jgi:twinkle protein